LVRSLHCRLELYQMQLIHTQGSAPEIEARFIP
jgi:hypothetical protein